MNQILSKSYQLKDQNGYWLGQIVLTKDGLFAGVTDYGNLSHKWRLGEEDFRKLLSRIRTEYFAQKLYCSLSYITHGPTAMMRCEKFAQMILPPLQAILKHEIDNNIDW